MPTSATATNRLRRIFRNLCRILDRQMSIPVPSTSKPLDNSRCLPCIASSLLILAFVALCVFTYLQANHSPVDDSSPIPRTFDSYYLTTPDTNATLRLILVVPPFTNSSLQPGVSPPVTTPYNAPALTHLLASLRDAEYDEYHPSLRIVMTPCNIATYAVVSTYTWPHGTLTLENGTTSGLFERVISAWMPARGARDAVALIDASRSPPFSTQWYRYVTSVRLRHGGRADIAGYGIEPVWLHKEPVPAADSGEDPDVFLYTVTPYIGTFIPASADTWRAFTRWFFAQRADWFLWPHVFAAKDRNDAAWSTFHGTARADWTLWFSRFCALHGMYTMYPRHTAPSKLQSGLRTAVARFALDGHVVRDDAASRIDAANVDRIVALGRKHGGTVSLTVINKAFLETAQSWLCNVDTAGIRPPGVVWITTDDDAYNGLKQVPDSYAVRMSEMRGGGKTGTSYGTPGYWLLMLERTSLIRDILERGVGVFAFETDQVWLRDPVPFVHRVVHGGDEVDIVGTLDTRHEIGGNFLYLNPTLATRRVWREVYRRFEHAYNAHGMGRHSAHFRRYMENDQSTLTKLVLFDERFKSRNPIVFRTLDTELFVDGRWYDDSHAYYKSARSRSPIMINNNFLIGIEKKKTRLQHHGHWFFKVKTCDEERVHRAIRENESRGVKAGLETVMDDGANQVAKEGRRPKRLEGVDVEANLKEVIIAVQKELG